MTKQRINVKERLSDGEIDLSMSDLHDVPVKEIAALKKATSLDLSNNHLKSLPANFIVLTHLVKLDLSKNELTELPDNFGDLTKLKSLDLYQNKLEYLPLSFHKLKSLKWLDLKDNSLVPAVAKVAGPCLDSKQCLACAKDVVNFFIQLQEQVESDLQNRERQRQDAKRKEMDNKKNRKKEKKGAQKESEPWKEYSHVNSKKQNVKKHKKAQIVERSCKKLSLHWFLLIPTTLITLFVLTSVKCENTVFVEDISVHSYKKFVSLLPEGLQIYATSIGGCIAFLHESVGHLTLQSIKVARSVDYVGLFATARDYVQLGLQKVQEQYRKVVS